MSKHHHDPRRWKTFVQRGRGPTSAASSGAGEEASADDAREGGGKRTGKGPVRPHQPLRGVRKDTPTRKAAAGSAASAPAATRSGAPGTPAAPRAPRAPHAPRAPQLDGQGLPYITLAQLLKKLNLVGSGGEAKATVRSGGITVNGEAEVRPGRKLHQGDKVTIAGHDHKVDLAVH